MPKKINSKFNFNEICNELGISLFDLQQLVNNKKNIEQNLGLDGETKNNASFLFEEFYKVLENKQLDTLNSNYTYRHYKSFIKRFYIFLQEKYSALFIEDLQMNHFNEFLSTNNKKKITYKQRTKNSYLFILRTLLGYFYEKNILKIDIRKRFTKRSVESLPRYFRDHEIELILRKCINRTYGFRWRTIFITLLGTGLRIHELVNLKIKDVDLKNNILFTIGKGKKERYVPIYPQVKHAIEKYLKTIPKDIILTEENYLFSRNYSENNQISISSIQKMYQKIRKELNLDIHLTVHSFRHYVESKIMESITKLNRFTSIHLVIALHNPSYHLLT